MKLSVQGGNRKLTGKGKRKTLVSGAAKLRKVGVWSITPVKTCPGSTPLCRKHCYDCKSCRIYPQVKPARERSYKQSTSPDFVVDMVEKLDRMSPLKFFRIHSGGDFYSQLYLEKWFRICRCFPGTKFLAFTKSFHLDFSCKPENLTIVWSIWPDTNMSKVPPGPRAYAGDCVPKNERPIECVGTCADCGMCWELPSLNRNVRFEIK